RFRYGVANLRQFEPTPLEPLGNDKHEISYCRSHHSRCIAEGIACCVVLNVERLPETSPTAAGTQTGGHGDHHASSTGFTDDGAAGPRVRVQGRGAAPAGESGHCEAGGY